MKPEERLAEWIGESRNIVFFGGAGTSTESGIPDFRSAAGLYRQEEELPYPPEVMLSRTFFMEHADVFFDFYRSKMLHPAAEPNGCHRLLAELETSGRLKAVVTQNIDGLHQKAGSSRVLELHGSVHRNYCMKCSRFYSLEQMMAAEDTVPRCKDDDGIIKPDVVLYEESLNQETLYRSIEAISQADLLMIGGTSLTVHPAASLITYFQGARTVLLNADPTPYDSRANLLITEPIGEVMERVGMMLSLG
ncbi:NAD-dependent protein deacylase [Paenibacillus sp. P96]|uniref:NAD-dependent protein deacetylase n=1 Tax=Paenibacillus zeirhizosphaerae TaxID=2987519 RepID=A0ABT9FKW2_9BACL|nr:NAD-dependent protein deacylase [Paenibacillus sp. P96]MDP4095240.1 NAD-dependent protein deacylase [Paenibacillus sp. P96]